MNMIGQPIIALIEKKSAEHLFDDQQPTLNMLKEKRLQFFLQRFKYFWEKKSKKVIVGPSSR